MAGLKTRDIKGVEILAVGFWHGTNCPPKGCEFTTDDLDQLVEAHQATKGLQDVPVKLGHSDDQKLLQADGFPAAGWVTNLRRRGKTLIADLAKVPKAVADLIDAGAYRKRSTELQRDWEIGGVKYPRIVTGLALLGADLPAVQGLEDITALYNSLRLSLDEGTNAILMELPVGMSYQQLEEKLRAAVRAKFPLRDDGPWIAETYDTFVIVSAGGRYFRLPYELADDEISLGEAEEVQRVTNWMALSQVAEQPQRLDLAEWTRAFINDLPDSAFAHIEPGGEKDEEGKTTPRRLRHLPHHGDDDGEVDLPHLRNALSRLPRTKLPVAAKRQALRHLQAHARSEGVGENEQARLAREIAEETEEVAMAINEQAVREALGLTEDADIVEAIVALKEGAGANGSGNEGEVAELKRELSDSEKRILTLEGKVALSEAERQVDEAIQANRLLPKQREMAIKLALRDAEEFEEFLKTQPEGLVQLGEKGTSGDYVDAEGTAVDLSELEPTAQEVAVARQMGKWNPEYRVQLMRTKAAERGIELPADFGKPKEKES